MSTITTPRVTIPAVDLGTEAVPHLTITRSKPITRALRREYDQAVINLAHEEAKVENYTRYPALDKDGGPLPLPMRRRIALATVTKRHTAAKAAYEARYRK